MTTDPADLGARAARDLFVSRALSPVELAEACIARVERLDHAVNAVVARDFERVREGARAAEAAIAQGEPLPPLAGLPLAVKDMEDVAGLPTTFGSEIFAENVPARDDAFVGGLRAAGALPLGKTNVPEWSAGANTRNRVYGTTPNPFDLTRNAAGSSGGSAVALALGYAPLATGSDMGGSLRTPAAYNGVVGFRPSPGIVPDDKRALGALPLGLKGPMARDVGDVALLLSVMARPDPRDVYTAAADGRTAWDPSGFASLPPVDLASLRVAVTPDFGVAPTEAAVRALFSDRIARLSSLFGTVEETHPDSHDADRLFAVLRALSFLAAFSDFLRDRPHQVGPNVTANVIEGQGYSAEDAARAIAGQTAYQHRWRGFFDRWDVLISPTATIQPRDWHELAPTEIDGRPTESYYQWLSLAYATTLAGHPSITVPCGVDADGLPFGLQIVGQRLGDRKLLAVAAAIEAAIAGTEGLARPRPDLAMLAAAPPIAEAAGFRDL
ncbi:amidase [Roseivivax isoporae]|uniref:Amidase n=1 Tax=Roseivivax isoporae LMG 25204 TaxID=1449351 RepID=X7FAJ5_9RHOB|nr:amidase family protein [Roseivivax isoporae]ETX29743.1 amidase [Roseivivax isoporae LMG 25204]